MSDFKPWIPPAGEVVDPPVHPLTVVNVIYSDHGEDTYIPARDLNWSGEGDGPKIIAYSVVEEYVEKREPREWWIAASGVAYSSPEDARRNTYSAIPIIHVREVLPEAPLDLTKITTPFGLLDEATQAALKAHGGPYEFWAYDLVWTETANPVWLSANVYRVAPSAAPAKPAPREVVAWAVVDGEGYAGAWRTESAARDFIKHHGGTVVKLSGFMP